MLGIATFASRPRPAVDPPWTMGSIQRLNGDRRFECAASLEDPCGLFLDEARIVAGITHPNVVQEHKLATRSVWRHFRTRMTFPSPELVAYTYVPSSTRPIGA